MEERRYSMQDGNWNTIAICDTSGSVGERYACSAYFTPVFMTGASVVQTSSAVGFETLYAGYRYDGTTPQMYYVRNRFLLPMIGTWNRRDPLGYVDGMGLYYAFLILNGTDPFGKEVHETPPKLRGYGKFDGEIKTTNDVYIGLRAKLGPDAASKQTSANIVQQWVGAMKNDDCYNLKPLWITWRDGDPDYPSAEFAKDANRRLRDSRKNGRCAVFLYIGHTTAGELDIEPFKDYINVLTGGPDDVFIGLTGCKSDKYNELIPGKNKLKGCPDFTTNVDLTEMTEGISNGLKPLNEQLKELCEKCGCLNDPDNKKQLDVYLYFGQTTIQKTSDLKMYPRKTGTEYSQEFGFSAWPSLGIGSK